MTLFQKIKNYKLRVSEAVVRRISARRYSQTAPEIQKNSLLLLRLDSIGDYVLFRNFIQSLKESEKYKNYSITLCGNSWWKELAENLDKTWVDEFIWLDYARLQEPFYRLSQFKKLFNRGFEVLVHPTFSRDQVSDLLVMHSGAATKIGYDGDLVNLDAEQKKKNDTAYTTLIAAQPGFLFEFYRNQFFFTQLLSEKSSFSRPYISHPSQKADKIIFCPGAKDAFRRWQSAHFVTLYRKLKADFPSDELLICGSQQDSGAAEEILHAVSGPVTNLCGKLSLYQLLSVFAEARIIVTNDSGPFHLAVALNKRVACISNGNNYGRFTPYPKEMNTLSTVLFPKKLLEISSEEERLKRFCKHGSGLDINSIEVEQVHAAIKQLF